MKQIEMSNLFGISIKNLQDLKNNNNKLYLFLKAIDYNETKYVLENLNNEDVFKLINNENYFDNYRVFEEALFNYLVSKKDVNILKKFAKNNSLSKTARTRSAYLYTFLTRKLLKLNFKLKEKTGLYHGAKYNIEDGLSSFYNLLSGIDINRFNQFKTTGVN